MVQDEASEPTEAGVAVSPPEALAGVAIVNNMPFKSTKQRTWMRIPKPGLYKRWEKKYGIKIKHKKG